MLNMPGALYTMSYVMHAFMHDMPGALSVMSASAVSAQISLEDITVTPWQVRSVWFHS